MEILKEMKGIDIYRRGEESVMDYIIKDKRTKKKIRKMEIEPKVDSNDSITMWIEESCLDKEGKERRKKGRRKREVWTEKERRKFVR